MESDGQTQQSLESLFRSCDADNSGRIEKGEFFRLCSELHVRSEDADAIFCKLDTGEDGAINLDEFVKGFQTAASFMRQEEQMGEQGKGAEAFSLAWEDFRSRLGEQEKYIP
ncbi:hypothetical protein SRHO_G00331510, partial [Serrasalmus rhombeus]